MEKRSSAAAKRTGLAAVADAVAGRRKRDEGYVQSRQGRADRDHLESLDDKALKSVEDRVGDFKRSSVRNPGSGKQKSFELNEDYQTRGASSDSSQIRKKQRNYRNNLRNYLIEQKPALAFRRT